MPVLLRPGAAPVLILLCAGYQLLLTALGAEVATPLSEVVNPLVIAGALLACVRAAARTSGRMARTWVLAAVAMGLYLAGTLLQVAGPAMPPDGPSAAIVPLTLSALLAPLVLLSWPRPPRPWTRRLRGAVDGLVAACALVVVTWPFLLEPIVHSSSAATLPFLAFAGLQVITLALALVAVAGSSREQRASLGWVVAGVGTLALADLAYTHLLAERSAAVVNGTDGAFALSALLIAGAAARSGRVPPRPRGTTPLVLAPYLPLAAALAVAVQQQLAEGRLDPVLVWVGLVVIVLVVARQGLSLVDNLALTRELAHERAQLATLVDHVSVGLVHLAPSGRIRLWNPAAERIYGWSAADAVGRLAPGGTPEDWPELAAVRRRATAAGERHVRTRADGSPVEVEVTTAPLPAGGGLAMIVDVTERSRLERAIAHQALHDPLTGLPNRALLTDRIATALARLRRRPGRLGVLVIDLDGFKWINDTLGHVAGDELLRAVAERLCTATRPTDTVVRLGGDEFVVLVDDLPVDEHAALEACREVAARVHAGLASVVPVADTSAMVGASIGVATTDGRDGWDADQLLGNADLAMYAGKRRAKGGCEIFRPELREATRRRAALERELREALVGDEFVVHFQPIVELEGGVVQGAEALVRWRHPERGLVPPGDFLPAVEELGLMPELGRRVLADALREVARWNDGRPDPLFVTVNLAPAQLAEAGFAEQVLTALEEAGVPPSWLVLELTEDLFVTDARAAAQVLGVLKAHGVTIALDDFGTGCSALGYLRELPVDLIKLDRSFVQDMEHAGDRARVAEGIIALAATLGLTAIAEGIEQPGQTDRLRELACGLGQGFLYARPLAADAFAALAAEAAPR